MSESISKWMNSEADFTAVAVGSGASATIPSGYDRHLVASLAPASGDESGDAYTHSVMLLLLTLQLTMTNSKKNVRQFGPFSLFFP